VSRHVEVATSPLVSLLPGTASDLVLDLGSAHPSSHPGLRLALELDGEVITSARAHVGLMHRGAEKLFEVRDYRQALVLANRHDWLSAFSNELGIVLLLERMLGVELPPRATWCRTLLAELSRALSHLAFLGTFPLEGPANVVRAIEGREALQAVLEEISGGRIHSMLNQVGGLRGDIPEGWADRVRVAVGVARSSLAELEESLLADPRFIAATDGVGHLSRDLVEPYGLSGAVARASGYDLDVRRDDAYLGYAELAEDGLLRVPLRESGDVRARVELLAEQTGVALALVIAAADRLDASPPGPVRVRMPKSLRVPEGEAYAWTEGPLGASGYYLVSRGERTPWRLKMRTPSYAHVQVLEAMLPGCPIAHLVPVLASLAFVVGDIDR
jgi:NADH-quinone oxidoreductase subunit D